MSAVKHPYELNTDTELNSTTNKHFVNNTVTSNDRFAVIEFSGRQYKVAEVYYIYIYIYKYNYVGVHIDYMYCVATYIDIC